MKITVQAKRNDEILKFSMVPYEHPLAYEWCEELKKFKEENIEVLERGRIYGLNREWNAPDIIKNLKNCYEIINKWKPIIGSIDFSEPSQELMNELHVYFENMVGLDHARSRILEDSPPEVAQAVIDFNIMIHLYEDYYRHKMNQTYSRLVVTFNTSRKHFIKDEDFQRFTLAHRTGDVVLNYCHVGKPIWDVIKDNDHHVTLENILPQSKWSGDFMVLFTPGHRDLNRCEQMIDQFWKERGDDLKRIGLQRNDPKLAIGRLPVARLEEDPMELRERIYGITEIVDVSVEDELNANPSLEDNEIPFQRL